MKTSTNESANFSGYDTLEGPTLFQELGAQFSARLDALVDARDLTNREVAAMAGCAESTVRKWRKGLSTPDVPMLYALACALETDVRDLIDGGAGGATETPSGHPDRPPVAIKKPMPIRDGVLYLRSPTLFETMAGVVYALDAQCRGLSSERRADVGYWALRALDLVTEDQGNQRALGREDYEALVRIVAKLRHPARTGDNAGDEGVG